MSLSLRENGCEYREDLWRGAVWMNGVSGQRSKKGSVANIVGTPSDQNEVGAMRQSVISENSLSAQVPKLWCYQLEWRFSFRGDSNKLERGAPPKKCRFYDQHNLRISQTVWLSAFLPYWPEK